MSVETDWHVLSDYSRIHSIRMSFSQPKKPGKTVAKTLQNIVTLDTESSGGWLDEGGRAWPYLPEKCEPLILTPTPGGAVWRENPQYDHEYATRMARITQDPGQAVSCLWLWQVGIEDTVTGEIEPFCGRTVESLKDFLAALAAEVKRQAVYGLLPKVSLAADTAAAEAVKTIVAHMIIFVHNLSWDFNFLRNIYDAEMTHKNTSKTKPRPVTFARAPHRPMKTQLYGMASVVEVRDSFVLANLSLEKWSEGCAHPKIKEPASFYTKIRHPGSRLTPEDLEYSVTDVVALAECLIPYRQKYHQTQSIPLTQTGEVRVELVERVAKQDPDWVAVCRNAWSSYTPQRFKDLVQLYSGGLTHANRRHASTELHHKIHHDLVAHDLASAYPAVMTLMTFPLGAWQECPVSDFADLAAITHADPWTPKIRWYAKVTIKGLCARGWWSIISSSKCVEPTTGVCLDNGRIHSAETVTLWINDNDYENIIKIYDWDDITVHELNWTGAGRLSKALVELILDYFYGKTQLKGVAGKEYLYAKSKIGINGIYGVFVFKIVSDIINFVGGSADLGGWTRTDATDLDIEMALTEQFKKKHLYCVYQIGIWVTSLVRAEIVSLLTQMDAEAAYSDTDSIKAERSDRVMQAFSDFNRLIDALTEKAATDLGISPSRWEADTPKGVHKHLGYMDREEDICEFVTYGAKRYAYTTEPGGVPTVVVAGLPKAGWKETIHRIEDFKNGQIWTTLQSHKSTHYYTCTEPASLWVDEDGLEWTDTHPFGAMLQPTTFSLELAADFGRFLAAMEGTAGRDDFDETPIIFKQGLGDVSRETSPAPKRSHKKTTRSHKKKQ